MQGLVHTDFHLSEGCAWFRGIGAGPELEGGCASEAHTRNFRPHQPLQEEQGKTSLEQLCAAILWMMQECDDGSRVQLGDKSCRARP